MYMKLAILAMLACWCRQVIATDAIHAARAKCGLKGGKLAKHMAVHSQKAMSLYKTVLKIDKHHVKHCRVLPFTGKSGIKAHLLREFPKTWGQYNKRIKPFKESAEDLIKFLHAVDEDYFGYQLLGKDKKKEEFDKENNANRKTCLGLVHRLPKKTPDNPDIVTRIMQKLCLCVGNAPANMRPGYKRMARKIGRHVVNPMLKKDVDDKYRVQLSDLTMKSILYAIKFNMKFFYGGKSPATYILSADQPPHHHHHKPHHGPHKLPPDHHHQPPHGPPHQTSHGHHHQLPHGPPHQPPHRPPHQPPHGPPHQLSHGHLVIIEKGHVSGQNS